MREYKIASKFCNWYFLLVNANSHNSRGMIPSELELKLSRKHSSSPFKCKEWDRPYNCNLTPDKIHYRKNKQ